MPGVSTFQQRPETATVANQHDYLDLPLAWIPSRRFEHGQVYEYRLALGAEDVAILQLVPAKGWAMTIAHGLEPAADRGLFASPHDALMVVLAEFDLLAVEVAESADVPAATIASGS